MAVDIGYNPAQYSPAGAGVQSLEQWIASMASQYTVIYANGGAMPGQAFSNETWASMGLPPLPPESRGATAQNPNNAINPGVYSGLHMFFTQVATHPENAQRAGITVPQLPSMGPVLDDLGRQQIFTATQNAANNQNNLDVVNAQNAGAMARDQAGYAFQGAENAADRAAQMAIANMQEAGMSARHAAEMANRMSIAQLQEAGESARNAARIAADIQMNSLNNETQRYGIDTNAAVAREDLAGRERIATADRTSREGIATADRQESARQFDLNLGEDRRQFNASMLFELFGMGVELMKNPVDWLAYQYYLENLSIPVTAINMGVMADAFGAVPQTGPSEVGPMVGGPAILDGDFEAAQATGVTPAFVALSQALTQNPGNPTEPGAEQYTAPVTAQSYDIGSAEQMLAEARDGIARDMPEVAPLMGSASSAGAPAPQPPVGGTTNQANSMVANLPSVPGAQNPATSSGIYTGQGGQTQPMEELMRSLAQQLGMNEAELWKMSGAGNMTPAYSKEAIANAPVIQALKNGASSMSQFATQQAPSTASPTAAQTGLGLGLRGGQDLNAQLMINNTQGNKGLIQGAVMADGHDWDTFMQQALKASPISPYEVGAFGRRRN